MTTSWRTCCVASLLLGILNAFVRPILMLIALPLLIFTLGLFTLVINAAAAVFRRLPDAVRISRWTAFGYAFLGALIISVISVALNVLTGNARVSVQRRRRRSRRKLRRRQRPGD